MTLSTKPTTFPRFSELPTELRLQIWANALPEDQRLPLFPYKRGCWSPRYLSPSDEGYLENANIDLEFRHDLLAPLERELPLASANQEARFIAFTWCRKQGMETRYDKKSQCDMAIRKFNPKRDALYVTLDQLAEFCGEPYDSIFESDLIGQNIGTHVSLTRIAVPAGLFLYEIDILSDVFGLYHCIEVMLVVVHAQVDVDDDETNDQLGWELEDNRGRAILWNPERRDFDSRDGECMGDGTIYQTIDDHRAYLRQVLISSHFNQSLEIQPVRAVRGRAWR